MLPEGKCFSCSLSFVRSALLSAHRRWRNAAAHHLSDKRMYHLPIAEVSARRLLARYFSSFFQICPYNLIDVVRGVSCSYTITVFYLLTLHPFDPGSKKRPSTSFLSKLRLITAVSADRAICAHIERYWFPEWKSNSPNAALKNHMFAGSPLSNSKFEDTTWLHATQ